jgi:hypothetical protein
MRRTHPPVTKPSLCALSAAFCLLLAAFCSLSGAQESVRGPAEAWGRLAVKITDNDTGETIPARCYLTDPAGQVWSPAGAINYVKPPEFNFVTAGDFELALPPRLYTLVVERGPEYHPATRQIAMHAGERREETVELARWINMNARGWYSGDLHNHRAWQEMHELLRAEDLNLAPTLTEWVWEDAPISHAPPLSAVALAAGPAGETTAASVGADGRLSPNPGIKVVDATHAYSVFDTEIERLRDGPGAVDLVALRSPVNFHGYLLYPPNDTFAAEAHRRGGYVDAEKIVWRDVAALVALGDVDFAGVVYNHFNRHNVYTETDPWGMIPKDKPEYATPGGMPLWALEVYYKFLNCGFRLPVSAGSASGVMPSPVGFERVYVHLGKNFGYGEWFAALKAGRSFATNGPMLFLTVNGREPGSTVRISSGARLEVDAEAGSGGNISRLEIVWKGQVIKTVQATDQVTVPKAHFEIEAKESGWLAARAFEKPAEAVRFAQTSPVYVQVGQDRGIVPEDARFFLNWIDREIKFYENLPAFRSDSDRQAMLEFFRKARAVYERLAAMPTKGKVRGGGPPGEGTDR